MIHPKSTLQTFVQHLNCHNTLHYNINHQHRKSKHKNNQTHNSDTTNCMLCLKINFDKSVININLLILVVIVTKTTTTLDTDKEAMTYLTVVVVNVLHWWKSSCSGITCRIHHRWYLRGIGNLYLVSTIKLIKLVV